MQKPQQVKRLFFDLETSPNLALTFRIGNKVSIGYQNIVRERAVICAAWKWQGDKRVSTATWDKNQSDKALLEELVAEAKEADEIVGHNCDRYDVPWLRTRCLINGLDAMPAFRTLDTLKVARRLFAFNSNRLDYISQVLGVGKKRPTDFDLWKRIVLNNDPKALRDMVRYCGNDVDILEGTFTKLQGYMPAKTHVGVVSGRDRWSCPHCGSEHVKKTKNAITATGLVQHQMKCLDCGRYFTIANNVFKDYCEATKD